VAESVRVEAKDGIDRFSERNNSIAARTSLIDVKPELIDADISLDLRNGTS
jgi:hypothetical protein